MPKTYLGRKPEGESPKYLTGQIANCLDLR